jgi:glycosyltransferase involved in cell wall biosynthesis
VHFLGDRDDVPWLMNEARLLVHAAREEPLGRVLLEACASGLPVVATAVGGTAEIFPADCGAAVLVPQDDAESMCRAILGLLLDESRRRVMCQAARKRARECFDSAQTALRLGQIYRESLQIAGF